MDNLPIPFCLLMPVFLHELPGVHVAPPVPLPVVDLLCAIVESRGVDRPALLAAAGLDVAQVDGSQDALPAHAYAALIHQSLALTQDPCLGLELGLKVPPTLFGFMGLALMCAETLGEALQMGVRYAPLGSRFVSIEPEEHAEGVWLAVKEKMPLGFAHQFAMESTIAAWLSCASHLGGQASRDAHLSDARITWAWSRPEAYGRYAASLPPATFDAEETRLFIPKRLLDVRSHLAQPLVARQARDWCERELAKVRTSDESFTASVADALGLPNTGYASLPRVAEKLQLSARTLARRLERQGVNFRAVVNERRRLQALELLRSSTMSIDDIGTQLGYLNPANFTRAFKRWTGETPSAFRRRVSQGE